jgi:hypothetical protein
MAAFTASDHIDRLDGLASAEWRSGCGSGRSRAGAAHSTRPSDDVAAAGDMCARGRYGSDRNDGPAGATGLEPGTSGVIQILRD